MKTSLVTFLLVLEVLGEPQRSAIRSVTRRGCAVADDLVCPRDDITFWLYTKSTQDAPTRLEVGRLRSAPWVDGPLKFIVHGYSVDRDSAVNAVLRPAYFSAGEYNIISVDWSPLGQEGCYTQAIDNVPTVARCVAEFFNAVTKARRFKEVHLLGHSMGAHIAAWASADIPGLPRLTKFDIANPLFNGRNSKNGTAGFIDNYLSNSGVMGQRRPSGDVDVYFNDNVFQPGCGCDLSCSHLRAVELYADSIGGTMRAFPCGGWRDYVDGVCPRPRPGDLVTVGEHADTTARGTYMVFTKAQPPFLFQKDTVYTNEARFNSFKRSLANECPTANNLQSIVRSLFLI